MKEDKKQWYVVHTYSGHEKRVKANLEQRIKSMNIEGIYQVVIPTEEEIEVKGGKRRTVTKKTFPGYILIQMGMDDRRWNIVRTTPGVTGFVSSQDREGRLIPAPLDEKEVEVILKRMEAGAPRVKVGFSKGQGVRISEGPFIDFVGMVDEVNPERGKLKVMVSFLGRETPVELDLLQVERL
jgi:transcriptional antiterminator NusG